MSATSNKGTSVSFNNTPQAADDFFSAALSGFTEDSLGIFVFNVMVNDSGGNATSLYSLDDGIESAGLNGELLQQDAVGSADRSLHGATIKITADGKVSYDASTLDASFVADLQHLGTGQFATDTFTYAIRLGNGTLSWATAVVQVAGFNDAPVFVSPATNAQVVELADTSHSPSPDTAAGSVGFTDLDFSDTHTASVVADGNGYLGTISLDAISQDSTNGHTGSVGWHFSVADSALDFLGANEQRTQRYIVTVDDGHGGTTQQAVNIRLTGSNDTPVLQAPVASDPVLGDDSLTVTNTMAFADLDLADSHSTTFTPQSTGYVGNFQPVITTDANGHGSITAIYHLTRAQVEANGGAFPDHQDYLVTVNDGHGGTASQLVSIPLGTILSGIGDHGGGGTTVDPPVFTNTSPPGPFTTGHNLGQITDNPFVLHPSFIPPGGFSTDLFTQGTLQFVDPDGGFHHASVDLAHAHVVAHSAVDSNGVLHPVAGPAAVGVMDGTWQVFVQEPGQVQWTYTLSEFAIRGMTSGETETIIVPITVFEDGVGQSTQNVRIDLFGRDEPTSMLAPNVVLTANTDITPYLLPIDLATHVQTLNTSISEDVLVTGSTSHHTLTGAIPYVDPDVLDRPTVTMTVADMTHSLDANPGDATFNAAVQPLMAGFSYTVEQFGNYGMIHWTYDVADSALDFLSQGSSLTASANFSAGTLAGGAFTTVNINLQGANDAPMILGSTTTFGDVALHGSASGSFTLTDPDGFPDGHAVQFVPHDPGAHGFIFGGTPVESGQGGSEPISWNYTADFGAGTLVAGQHDVWDVVVQDHFGAFITQTLDFHLV